MHESIVCCNACRLRCRKASSRSLSHLLMSFLFWPDICSFQILLLTYSSTSLHLRFSNRACSSHRKKYYSRSLQFTVRNRNGRDLSASFPARTGKDAIVARSPQTIVVVGEYTYFYRQWLSSTQARRVDV